MPYVSDNLDLVDVPTQWLMRHPSGPTHLLDHTWLFDEATLITYFRSINYRRMSKAFEEAADYTGHVNNLIRPGSLMVEEGRRRYLYRRLQVALSRFLVLEIRRANVLEDAFDQLWRRQERELFRPIKIRLGEDTGEEGADLGGVQQEFFRLAIAEAMNPDYGGFYPQGLSVFIADQIGVFTVDPTTRMAWFQPGSAEPLYKLELIGLIIGLAVYNGVTLPLTFPKVLYAKLFGWDEDPKHNITNVKDIHEGWPDTARGLQALLDWHGEDVSEVFVRTYEFSIDAFGTRVSQDITTRGEWPQFGAEVPVADAPLVTNANRDQYVVDYIDYLINRSVQPQFSAFKKGFFSVVSERSLKLLKPDVLQSLIEGVQTISIDDLQRTARYEGWTARHRVVREFWKYVSSFDEDKKRKLMEFVTASQRIPAGGMEGVQFVVQHNGTDDEHLPTSYTCYGILLLPAYSSAAILRERLDTALEYGSQGFGFA